MLWYLSDKDRLTAVVTALLPVSLLLGFLLNTVIWAWMNPSRKALARSAADKKFEGLRDVIAQVRNHELNQLHVGQPRAWPRDSFEYYFLCSVEVERLAHLWESYFSWYEFHINSALALPIFSASAVLYAGLSFLGTGPLVGHPCLAICSICLAIGTASVSFFGLSKTAARNLEEYEKSLLLLIAGSLRKTEPDKGTPPQPPAQGPSPPTAPVPGLATPAAAP